MYYNVYAKQNRSVYRTVYIETDTKNFSEFRRFQPVTIRVLRVRFPVHGAQVGQGAGKHCGQRWIWHLGGLGSSSNKVSNLPSEYSDSSSAKSTSSDAVEQTEHGVHVLAQGGQAQSGSAVVAVDASSHSSPLTFWQCTTTMINVMMTDKNVMMFSN